MKRLSDIRCDTCGVLFDPNSENRVCKCSVPENPKEHAGRQKCQMQLLSPAALRATADALALGARKYGAYNTRHAGINATTYVGAIMRHLTAWRDGEDLDPESGLSHIAHVSACCDILLDCMSTGMMNDDRVKHPDYVERTLTPLQDFVDPACFRDHRNIEGVGSSFLYRD